jgi:hypothetical protein
MDLLPSRFEFLRFRGRPSPPERCRADRSRQGDHSNHHPVTGHVPWWRSAGPDLATAASAMRSRRGRHAPGESASRTDADAHAFGAAPAGLSVVTGKSKTKPAMVRVSSHAPDQPALGLAPKQAASAMMPPIVVASVR